MNSPGNLKLSVILGYKRLVCNYFGEINFKVENVIKWRVVIKFIMSIIKKYNFFYDIPTCLILIRKKYL